LTQNNLLIGYFRTSSISVILERQACQLFIHNENKCRSITSC